MSYKSVEQKSYEALEAQVSEALTVGYRGRFSENAIVTRRLFGTRLDDFQSICLQAGGSIRVFGLFTQGDTLLAVVRYEGKVCSVDAKQLVVNTLPDDEEYVRLCDIIARRTIIACPPEDPSDAYHIESKELDGEGGFDLGTGAAKLPMGFRVLRAWVNYGELDGKQRPECSMVIQKIDGGLMLVHTHGIAEWLRGQGHMSGGV